MISRRPDIPMSSRFSSAYRDASEPGFQGLEGVDPDIPIPEEVSIHVCARAQETPSQPQTIGISGHRADAPLRGAASLLVLAHQRASPHALPGEVCAPRHRDADINVHAHHDEAVAPNCALGPVWCRDPAGGRSIVALLHRLARRRGMAHVKAAVARWLREVQ